MASLRRSARVSLREELSTALAALGLVDEAPVIVVVGGAARMGDDETGRVRAAFVEAVVPAADAAGAVVVDGGTAVGVMRLMGEARTARDAGFPLVGVVV